MVIGYAPYITKHPYNYMTYRLLAIEYLSHAAVAGATAGLDYPVTCVGTNLAYRKDVFIKLGGFGKFRNVHSGDDDLFLQRVREETDWKIRYALNLGSQVPNAPPQNWRKFYHQRLRYASKGFLYPRIYTLILSAFYIYNLLIVLNLIMLLFSLQWLYSLSILFVIKFLSDYLFMIRSGKILHDRRSTILLPVAIVLHIPYVLYFGMMAQIQGYHWAGRKG
jgi:cellulose synthase/poly-beta-1,6-N-acetylglucosamine synthase-like glycosyltransferase